MRTVFYSLDHEACFLELAMYRNYLMIMRKENLFCEITKWNMEMDFDKMISVPSIHWISDSETKKIEN